MLQPQREIYEIADIYALPNGQRAELIDGRMYMMAPPSTIHQRISSELHGTIYNYIKTRGGTCNVFAAPFAVFINKDERNYVEPDISVICDRAKIDENGCNGAGITKVPLLKALGVDVVDQCSGAVLRSALGHDVRLSEELHGLDHGDHDHIFDRAFQSRQCDVQELLDLVGAVHGGCLILVSGDSLQACQEDHHLITCALPSGHEDDGAHGRFGVGQEVDGFQSQAGQKGVDQSGIGIGIIKDCPQDGDDHHGGQLRAEIHGTEDGDSPESGRDQHGQCKSQYALERHNKYGEVYRIAQCQPEILIGEQLQVIFEANKGDVVRSHDLILEQRIIDCIQDRDDQECK